MGWLDIGAGAGEGLDNLLQRMLRERMAQQQQQRIDEEVRSNKAGEGYKDRALQETSAQRQLAQQSLDMTRQSEMWKRMQDVNNQQRDDTRASVNMIPIGSEVSADEYSNAKKVGGVSDTLFDRSMKGRDANDEDYGPLPVVKFKGSEDAQIKRMNAEKEKESGGTVHDTGSGLVRIDKDAFAKPVVDAQGNPVKGYHAPPQPITVQTIDASGNPVTKIVPKTVGTEYAGKPPQGIQSRMYTARGVLSHMTDVKDEIGEADSRGLLGPIEGRWSDFLAGKVGSTGNEENDALLGQLRMDLKLLTSGTVAAHFQSRGGQQMMHDFQSLLDSGKFSKSELLGAIGSMEKWLGNYAQNPNNLATPGGAAKGAKPSAADLIKKYGGG